MARGAQAGLLAARTLPDDCRAIVTNPPYGEGELQPGQRRSPAFLFG